MEKAQEFAKELETKSVEVAIKAGQDGRVFGSVSTKEIATAAKEQLSYDLDKKKMQLKDANQKHWNLPCANPSAPKSNSRT